MKNRNNHRLLNNNQIQDIIAQVALDLIKYSHESADTLVDHYLRDDAEGLLDIISQWIESAEDEVMKELNSQLNEDYFKQSQDDTDSQFHPSYEL